MYEIKTTKDAFNRLGFTLSKGNKPNNTDLEAFNFLVETFNKTIEKTNKKHTITKIKEYSLKKKCLKSLKIYIIK